MTRFLVVRGQTLIKGFSSEKLARDYLAECLAILPGYRLVITTS